jgi:hypothetical protein
MTVSRGIVFKLQRKLLHFNVKHSFMLSRNIRELIIWVGIATDYGLEGPGIESQWGGFSARPDRPWGPPSSCTIGTGSFPGVKYGLGVLLTTHPLRVPWSWKSRAIPLPTLWATTGPVTVLHYFFHIRELITLTVFYVFSTTFYWGRMSLWILVALKSLKVNI